MDRLCHAGGGVSGDLSSNQLVHGSLRREALKINLGYLSLLPLYPSRATPNLPFPIEPVVAAVPCETHLVQPSIGRAPRGSPVPKRDQPSTVRLWSNLTGSKITRAPGGSRVRLLVRLLGVRLLGVRLLRGSPAHLEHQPHKMHTSTHPKINQAPLGSINHTKRRPSTERLSKSLER